MRSLVKRIIHFICSIQNGRYGGKILAFLNFCKSSVIDCPNTFSAGIYKRMNMNEILPKIEFRDESVIELTSKVKVRILYPGGDSWNNIHTLYEAFISDERYQTYIIVPTLKKFVDIMLDNGCKYVTLKNYDVKIDKPDIFVATYYSTSDECINFPGCRNYMKFVIASIENAVMNEKNTDIHWNYINSAYKYLEPDFYLVDRLVYNGLRGYVPDEKLVEMGNPQFDEIYREVGRQHPIPSGWEKLSGKKKVFLWATDHGINESYPTNGFTVDLYLKAMLHYFAVHKDVGLIFRPHPQFIREMSIKHIFWSDLDVQVFRDYCDNSDNVVFDESYDYCCAYDACDALMVDANCSITCSFLTTGKPICRLMRTDINEWLISPELKDSYYYARGFDEVEKFMELVIEGRDEKENERHVALSKAILHFDGKNGERMKSFIDSAFINTTSGLK